MPEEAPPTVVAIVGPSGVSNLARLNLESFHLTITGLFIGWQDDFAQILDPSIH